MPAHPLFSRQEINNLRTGRRDALKAAIAEVKDSAGLSDLFVARQTQRASLEVPTLDRAGTKFHTTEQGEMINVVASVPFMGSAELFETRPNTFDHSPPRGSIAINPAYRGEGPGQVLELERNFERGTGAEQIKSWASKELDHVQAYLDWMRPDVNMHNSDVTENLTAGLERRRQELDGLDDLNRGLEGGL